MATHLLTIEDVNALGAEEFLARFGDVAEHSPWIAEAVFSKRPFADREALVTAFAAVVAAAPRAVQHAFVLEHPDLAGRAAIAGTMANESKSEQASAGLDRMTPEEFALFTELNASYRKRHGIPFIRAVRGSTKADIIAAFKERIGNEPEAEFQTALSQIARIFRFRIEDRVAP